MRKTEMRVTDAGLEIDCECGRQHRVTEEQGSRNPILETVYTEPEPGNDTTGTEDPRAHDAKGDATGSPATGPAKDPDQATGTLTSDDAKKAAAGFRILGFTWGRH